jgi:hypothetical protein
MGYGGEATFKKQSANGWATATPHVTRATHGRPRAKPTAKTSLPHCDSLTEVHQSYESPSLFRTGLVN